MASEFELRANQFLGIDRSVGNFTKNMFYLAFNSNSDAIFVFDLCNGKFHAKIATSGWVPTANVCDRAGIFEK